MAVALTPQGRESLLRALPVHATGIARHFVDRLDDDQLYLVKDAMRQVITECDFG